jgi:carbamoyltransferase
MKSELLCKIQAFALAEVADPAEKAAQLVASGKVIAWMQGRMEFGPRALGSRSILANPALPDIKAFVNQKIKFRESFRPFLPIGVRRRCRALLCRQAELLHT